MKNSPYLDRIRDTKVLQKIVNDYESARPGRQRRQAALSAAPHPRIGLVNGQLLFAQDIDNLGFRLGTKTGINQLLKNVEGGRADTRV